MNNVQNNRKVYESPLTKKTQVELEDGICISAASGTPIKENIKMEVQVDDWHTIDNDVTFE